MSADASSSLSPEIQQALQQAVGDANDAANITRPEKKDKKKKKRHREESDAADQTLVDGTEARDGEHERKKKKKKKRHHAETAQEVSTEVLGTAEVSPAELEPAVTLEPTPVETAVAIAAVAEVPPDPERRKKKKKKDKGKERAIEQLSLEHTHTESVPVEPIPAMDDTSSAEFLSAVVAAASATSGATQSHPPPDFHQVHPFPSFLQYPPPQQGYPFPLPPHPLYGHAPPPPFPDIPGLSSDLSSEDLLRTLQEIDISKIASVLKTLGDAAAVSNAQLNIPSVFVPVPPPPGPPSVRQRPVRSDKILGHPPRQSKGANKRPPLPPGLATTPPEPGDEGNPDHAHMLANVWMNAAKLSELVKKQGA